MLLAGFGLIAFLPPMGVSSAGQTPAPAPQPTSQSVELTPDLQAMRAEQQRIYAAAKQMPVGTLSDLVRLGEVDGFLTLSFAKEMPKLESTANPLSDWPGMCTANRMVLGHGQESQTIAHWEYRAPSTQINTHMSSLPMHVQVGISSVSDGVTLNMSVVQNRRFDMPAEVSFMIQLSRELQDGRVETLQQLRLSAPSFLDLIRDHGQDVRPWLREMFTRAGEPLLLWGGEKFAWRVLTIDDAQSADLREKVAKLVASLDDASPQVRAGARDALKALGESGKTALSRLDLTTLSFEQQTVVEELLADSIVIENEAATEIRDNPEFLLDAMMSRDEDLRERAASRLLNLKPIAVVIDPHLDKSARQQAVRAAWIQLGITDVAAAAYPGKDQ